MFNQASRIGSALLLVISLIVLMVTVATSFMTTMSRQRGTAVMLAAQTRCEIGMEHAQSILMKKALEEYVNADPYSMTSGSKGAKWYTDSLPVGDPDGDPWTEDGMPLGSGYEDTQNMVNVQGVNVSDMMQRSTGNSRTQYYGMWTQYQGTRSRWHNLIFYDDYMQPVEIDDSWSESKKADIRRTSRYVLRYTYRPMDCGAQLAANNNYPDAPIIFDGTNQLEYNRYQNYLRHFGRNIKSLTGATQAGTHNASDARQYRSNDGDPAAGEYSVTRDPFDTEELGFFPDGIAWRSRYPKGRDDGGMGLNNDLRLRRESAFRMSSLTWVETTKGLDQKAPHVMGGERFTTFYQLGRHNGCTGMAGAYYHAHFQFTPYAMGMLAEPLKTRNPDPCTVPWKLNMLTCSTPNLDLIFGAFSRHIKVGGGQAYNTDPLTGQQYKWWASAQRATADVFGPGYPEPFPLGYEDGKDIHIIGEVNAGSLIPSMKFDGLKGLGNEFIGGMIRASGNNGNNKYYPATANSYWVDLHYACRNLVYPRVQWAWRSRANMSSSTRDLVQKENYYFIMKNPLTGANIMGDNGDSYIDKNENDPDTMINQIIMETCRVMGEGYIKPHSGAVPATSWNKYDHSLPSLLAGGESYVGLNIQYRHNEHPMRLCKLSPQANTRAMEFILNDVLISLYGKANPHYDPASDVLRNIAVDFNGDGYAESTVSGWYNSSLGARVWSWWWNGLGPEAETTYPWMKQSSWIRFHEDGRIERKRGNQWLEITDATERSQFLQVNDIFLNSGRWSADNGPIRPFSHTGRLVIEKAKMFHYFMRVELFNIPQRKVMAAANRTFLLHIDPNNDGSFEDTHIGSQQEFDMQSSDY